MSSRLFKHLCKSVCEQQSYIDETVDAIAHAVFGAAVESAARFLHAQLPARIVQTMYLALKFCSLLFHHQKFLHLGVRVSGRTSSRVETSHLRTRTSVIIHFEERCCVRLITSGSKQIVVKFCFEVEFCQFN